MTPKQFKDSQEAAFRKMVRAAVRKGDFTKSERDITLALVDLWFHHKGGPKPYIHPSRAKVGRKAGVTEKTVSRALAMLRAANVLTAISGTKGGQGRATQYRLNIWPLMTLCGCDWVDEFMRGYRENVPVNVPVMSRYNEDKMSRCLIDARKSAESLYQEGETE